MSSMCGVVPPQPFSAIQQSRSADLPHAGTRRVHDRAMNNTHDHQSSQLRQTTASHHSLTFPPTPSTVSPLPSPMPVGATRPKTFQPNRKRLNSTFFVVAIFGVLLSVVSEVKSDCEVINHAQNVKTDWTGLKPFAANLQVKNNAPSQWYFDLCAMTAKICEPLGYVQQRVAEAEQPCGDTPNFGVLKSAYGGNGEPARFRFGDRIKANRPEILITVNCDPNGDPFNLKATSTVNMYVRSDGVEEYTVTFSSKIGCKGQTPSSPADDIGYDADVGAWVYVSLLLTAFVLYFAIGYWWNYKKRDLRGTEAIPHVEFWKDLPSLVKDGVVFSFKKCRGCCGRN